LSDHEGYPEQPQLGRFRRSQFEATGRRTWLCVAIAALGACSTQPHVNVIRAGDSVAVTSAADFAGSQSFDIRNLSIGQGAKSGAEAGGATGAAAGLFCGGLFWLCSPLFALGGAVAGAGTGAVVGGTQGVSADQAAQVTERIAQYLQQNDPQKSLVASVVHRADLHWHVQPRPADGELVVRLDAIRLHKKIDGPVVLVLRATVGFGFADRDGKPKTLTRTFEYEGPETYIESWTANNDEFLMQRFNDAYQTLADNIVVAFSKN
jgi:hypothetical protein